MSVTNPIFTAGGPATAKAVHPWNGYLARVVLEEWDSTTNAFTPWTGATDVRCSFTADEAGTVPIAALTGITLYELGAVAPGVYAEVIPGPTMGAALTPYLGQLVYQRVTAGPAQTLAVVTPLRVTQRWAQ